MVKPVGLSDIFKTFAKPEKLSGGASADPRIRLVVLLVCMGCIPGSGMVFAVICAGFVALFFTADIVVLFVRTKKGTIQQEPGTIHEAAIIRGLYRKTTKPVRSPHMSDALVIRGLGSAGAAGGSGPVRTLLNLSGAVGTAAILAVRLFIALGLV